MLHSIRGAALAILTAEPVISARIRGEVSPDPVEKLRQAMTRLKTHFGRLDPEWGEVNRFRRGVLDLAVDGGPDILRAIYASREEDGTLTAHGGDTLIMFVEWDRNDVRGMGPQRKAQIRKRTSLWHGDSRPVLATLRRPGAAICRNAYEACQVHAGRDRSAYRGKLSARRKKVAVSENPCLLRRPAIDDSR